MKLSVSRFVRLAFVAAVLGGCMPIAAEVGDRPAIIPEMMPKDLQKPLPDDFSDVLLDEAQVEIMAEFPNGTFLENLTVAGSGDLIFTSYFDKQLLRMSSDGTVESFAELPDHPVAVLELENGFIVTAHGTSFMEFPAFTETNSILFLNREGEVVSQTASPQAKFLNGLHRLPSGELLAADSIAGTVWQVDVATGELSTWLTDPLLGFDLAVETFLPGANGIKSHEGVLYVSNSSRGAIYRQDFAAGGELELFAETGSVDDLLIDGDGTIFATTHGDKLLKISPEGEISTVISTGCDGCTSVDFWPDRESLIVINDGDLLKGGKKPARVLRITNF